MARAPHKKAHEVCPFGVTTTWADCDKARDDMYVDWQAMQQVILAYNTVVKAGGETPASYRKEKGLYAQLVQLIGGTREDLTNDDGNPHEGAWALRLRAAIERFKAGDIPVYCLYRPVPPATNEGG
jgi:hypothetical protein